jgi:hypothetical protein
MAQVFHRSTNTISRFSISGGLVLAAVLAYVAYVMDRSPYATYESYAIDQPVPFSHKHHYSGLGIDCRYCHTTVENSAYAGMPSTETCMSCHSQIWRESPTLEPVRASFTRNVSMHWNRVYDLPNYVYFDHSIHIKKGVGCSSCHGRVDLMALTSKANSLQMSWCLDCHREPEKQVRPPSEIFNMAWQPGPAQEQEGRTLAEKNQLNRPIMTNCSTCHR